MVQLLPNLKRAEAAALLIKFALFLHIGMLLLEIAIGYYLIEMKNGNAIPYETAILIEGFSSIMTLLALIVFIFSAVTFIQWFRRAYYNLHLLNDPILRWKEGWAAGGWFVPIMSLYVPLQIMKDIWNATMHRLKDKYDLSTYNIQMVGWWWTLFLIANFLSNIAAQISIRFDSPDMLITANYFDIAADIISIAGAIITIRLIKQYTEMEISLHEEHFKLMNMNHETEPQTL